MLISNFHQLEKLSALIEARKLVVMKSATVVKSEPSLYRVGVNDGKIAVYDEILEVIRGIIVGKEDDDQDKGVLSQDA